MDSSNKSGFLTLHLVFYISLQSSLLLFGGRFHWIANPTRIKCGDDHGEKAKTSNTSEVALGKHQVLH